MGPFLFALLCLASAGLGAVLTWLAMRSRVEVLTAQQREELAGARASLAAQKEALEGSLKNVEESTRRQAMDEFLADIRVEERQYIREHKVLFMNRKMLVRQERIFFRNIPLSNWVEQEMPFEEGADMDKLAQTMKVFTDAILPEPPVSPIQRLLR